MAAWTLRRIREYVETNSRICFFVDLASWEESSLQMRKACIAPCGRESSDRLQMVGVGSLHNV